MNDLLRVENLEVSFKVAEGRIDAVRGVSFRVPVGGSVALVGESGSGKSVVSQAIMGILPNVAEIRGGRILFDDPGDPAAGRAPLKTDIAARCLDEAQAHGLALSPTTLRNFDAAVAGSFRAGRIETRRPAGPA